VASVAAGCAVDIAADASVAAATVVEAVDESLHPVIKATSKSAADRTQSRSELQGVEVRSLSRFSTTVSGKALAAGIVGELPAASALPLTIAAVFRPGSTAVTKVARLWRDANAGVTAISRNALASGLERFPGTRWMQQKSDSTADSNT